MREVSRRTRNIEMLQLDAFGRYLLDRGKTVNTEPAFHKEYTQFLNEEKKEDDEKDDDAGA